MVQKERHQANGPEKQPPKFDLDMVNHKFKQFERQSGGLWKTVPKLGDSTSNKESNNDPPQSLDSITEGVRMDPETAKAFIPYNDNDSGYQGEIHHGYQYYVPVSTPVHWNMDPRHQEPLPDIQTVRSRDSSCKPTKNVKLKLSHRDDVGSSGTSKSTTPLPTQSVQELQREHCPFCDNPLFKSMYCPLTHRPLDITEDAPDVIEPRDHTTPLSVQSQVAHPHILLTKCPHVLLYSKTNLAKVFRQNQLRQKEAKDLLEDIGELNEHNRDLYRNIEPL